MPQLETLRMKIKHYLHLTALPTFRTLPPQNRVQTILLYATTLSTAVQYTELDTALAEMPLPCLSALEICKDCECAYKPLEALELPGLMPKMHARGVLRFVG
jgi:hypothetical protein